MMSLQQLKDRINHKAKQNSLNAQILLRNYMMERLLERISLSDFKNHFILKGGMLVAALVGVELRSTIDMDATIKAYPVTAEALENAFNSIIQVKVDDGVKMKIKKISEIRLENEYNGYRISMDAMMDDARIPMKIDVTTGDKITPGERVYQYDLMLENRSIEILAYNVETVVAEKLETIIVRSTANTMMRDFYDVYVLHKLQGEKINAGVLKNALKETSQKRSSGKEISSGDTIIEEIFNDDVLKEYWEQYRNEYKYAEEITWDDVRQAVKTLWSSATDKGGQ